MKVIQLEVPQCQKCIIPIQGDCNDPVEIVKDHVKEMIFAGGDVGDKLTITVLEMTQEEVDALPEFEGF